jgi:hypothetical protein
VAYGHHALFSSGIFRSHAVHPELKRLWDDLYAAHADLILAGHEHSYERFAPQDPDGRADPQHGIREIIVGTGGRSHDPLGFALPNSEVQNFNTYGVARAFVKTGRRSRLGHTAKLIKSFAATLRSVNPEPYCLVISLRRSFRWSRLLRPVSVWQAPA